MCSSNKSIEEDFQILALMNWVADLQSTTCIPEFKNELNVHDFNASSCLRIDVNMCGCLAF